VAEHFGERTAVLTNAVVMLFSAILIAILVPKLRRLE
jgi:hypothetical protein